MTAPVLAPTRRIDFGPVFDADNHYWETSDAFTRYRSAKFADRGVRVAEHEGSMRYFIGDKLHPWLPGPGDLQPRPKPGALVDYFSGRQAGIDLAAALTADDPKDHPEYYDRDVRLSFMDRQGIAGTWMFPSHGVCVEGPMQPDIEAARHILGAFNRWVEDEWGFAYKDRIFGAPLITLSDVDGAVAELEWALGRGARVVVMRPGPVWTADGMRSPADRRFDPYWARVEEAGITVVAHPGFMDGYQTVDRAVAACWGVPAETFDRAYHHNKAAGGYGLEFVALLQKKRLVRDYAAALLAHGLFTRFPRLRLAFVETGCSWVGPLLHDVQIAHAQNPGMFASDPVAQFHSNCWVTPFVEDDTAELARHIPVERILFGSDWPHAEGYEHPRDFFGNLTAFSEADQRRIMLENARELTAPA